VECFEPAVLVVDSELGVEAFVLGVGVLIIKVHFGENGLVGVLAAHGEGVSYD